MRVNVIKAGFLIPRLIIYKSNIQLKTNLDDTNLPMHQDLVIVGIFSLPILKEYRAPLCESK